MIPASPAIRYANQPPSDGGVIVIAEAAGHWRLPCLSTIGATGAGCRNLVIVLPTMLLMAVAALSNEAEICAGVVISSGIEVGTRFTNSATVGGAGISIGAIGGSVGIVDGGT